VWGKAKIEGEGGEPRVIAQRVLLRAAEHLSVAPSLALLAGLEELLGAENVRVA
jgi:hypothetical protein